MTLRIIYPANALWRGVAVASCFCGAVLSWSFGVAQSRAHRDDTACLRASVLVALASCFIPRVSSVLAPHCQQPIEEARVSVCVYVCFPNSRSIQTPFFRFTFRAGALYCYSSSSPVCEFSVLLFLCVRVNNVRISLVPLTVFTTDKSVCNSYRKTHK